MIPAILFDLDGTLIDSLPDVLAAVNRTLQEEGRRPITLKEARLMVGEGAPPLVRRAFAATGAAISDAETPALVERYISHYRAAPCDETLVYPGVIPTLQALSARNVPMGICTNKPHGMSELALAGLGLDRYFLAMIGGDALPIKKPDPGHILAVLDAMGCDRKGAVYVGDSPTDAMAARNAGLPFILVNWGYSREPLDGLEADMRLDRFGDLPAALAMLDNRFASA